MSEHGAISPERDEIVGERGAGILTAQLRSHALVNNCGAN